MNIKIPGENWAGTVERLVKNNNEQLSHSKFNIEDFEKTMKDDSTKNVDKVETLEQWIDSLEDIKNTLDMDLSKENLDRYKESMGKFLDYYVRNELYLGEHKIRDGLLHTKKVQILKSIDDKLDSLTDKMISSQQGTLELMRVTGEISGMLFELRL